MIKYFKMHLDIKLIWNKIYKKKINKTNKTKKKINILTHRQIF